jgi:ribosomal protein L19
MCYFKKILPKISKRRKRDKLVGFRKQRRFFVGDVLEILLFYKNLPLVFEGVCLSIRRKNFTKRNTTIFLRSVILGVGIEIVVAFFFCRGYKYHIFEQKRLFRGYRRSKMLWYRINLIRRPSSI